MEARQRRRISGRAVVVRGADIDTDRIIPARFLRTVSFEELGAHVFADERGGHPFDEERFRGASILIVNQNFGCGSSREHAPQALMRWGIEAFVGESFAEIFFGNCVALGLPCVQAPAPDIARLMDAVEADAAREVMVDVAAQKVRFAGGEMAATMAEGARLQFLEGTWDALSQLLEVPEAIEARAGRLPYMRGFTN